jgi:hypothetical protein
MASHSTQTFENHTRFVTGFHRVTGGLLVVYLLWAIYRAVTLKDAASHHIMVGAFAMAGVAWYTRVFPLTAQDRIIRLEEQLRMARLLPEDLRGRAAALSRGQYVALRFASDEELPALVRWVVDNNVTDGKAIKQRIRVWRADTLRV